MPARGVIGRQSRRLQNPAADPGDHIRNLLRQPTLQLLLAPILMERQLPHPFDHPLRYAKLAQQTQSFLIEAEYPLAPVPQHVDYSQPVFPGCGEVSPVQRIAEDLAVLVYSIHARASIVYMLPRAAVQS